MKKINQERASRAELTIAKYRDIQGGGAYDRDPFDTVLADFLADLLHLCQYRRVNFDRWLKVARCHFEEEKLGRG